jgi:solute:Na+ symporter, SSS family
VIAGVVIGLYLALMLVLGVVGYRSGTSTPDDYFLAGRKVGPIVTFFTLVATNFSAFFFLGFAGAGYRIGFAYYAIMAFGTALVIVAFYIIGNRAWLLGQRHGYITPPELMGDRLRSAPLKITVLAVMVIFTLPYLALQPIGAGYLLAEISGGKIGQFTGAVLLTVFMVAYVFLGGMRSVALTDVVQGAMIFALIGLAVVVIGNAFGGVREANEHVFSVRPDLFSRAGAGDYYTPQIWISDMLLWVFAIPMFPQVFMRFFIPRSAGALQLATVLYPIVTALLFFGPILIGVWGHLEFPGLTATESDQILPMMMAEFAPDWLAALIMVGALAAFMSTMDSQLLALSSMLTRDVYVSFLKRDASVERQVLVGRILVVALSAIGLVIAYDPPGTFQAIVTQAFAGLAVLTPTTIAALYWRRATATGCVSSIMAGEATLVAFRLGWLPPEATLGFRPLLPALAVATILLVALGRWTRP